MQTISMPLLASGRKKQWSYASLCFSLFYFVPALLSDLLTASIFVKILLIYIMFVGVYLFTINVNLPRLPLALVSLSIVSGYATYVNAGGIVFFGFLSFIIGYYYRPRLASLLCIFLAGLAITALILSVDSRDTMIAAVVNMIVLYGFGLMERNETLQQQKDEQHNLSLQKLSAITERERIGRDLHDVAGHALSGISLKAQVAAKYLDKHRYEEAKQEVLQLAQLSQELLSEIRQTVTQIKHLGLEDEIDKAVVKLREAGFDTDVDVEPGIVTQLNAWQETQFSLMVKEAITNVLRHSQGTSVSLSISDSNGKLCFRCHDNGLSSSPQEGNGLSGIRERLDSLKGKLVIDTSQGFALIISIPTRQEGLQV